MSTKISDLAEKLGLDSKELKEKLSELGFDVSPRARVIDDEVAELVLEELSSDDDVNAEPEEVAEIYDELIAEEREREIIKSQRKMTSTKKSEKGKNQNADEDIKDKKSSSVVEIGESISVKEFADKSGESAAKIIGELMKNGILANINQEIDFETAQIIAEDLGVKVKKSHSVLGVDDMMDGDISKLLEEDDAEDLIERPPIICVMGHVDHGKTKLLDTIRKTDVVSGEAGGITQHIAAYQVKKNDKLLTFLDTPGHEAFTAMRARGAKVTDIAILVVAADEGIKPQTIEAYNHAKEAGVPIIVAMNKIDKPNANPDKVMGELTEIGLQPESWGGDTVIVPVSALTGEGIDQLLEMLILTSEMENLKANPDRGAVATVVESHLDTSLGPVATVLVNTGTLKIMNNFIVGSTYGRIKLMRDHRGKKIRVAGPSTPVFIAGLHAVPKSGDILQVVKDEKTAKVRALEVQLKEKDILDKKSQGFSGLLNSIQSDKILKIVLKADVKGTVEAIRQSLHKIKDEEVAIKIIHSGVGPISESDVVMASASNGIVLAFHVDFNTPNVVRIAEREGVEVRTYSVIYDLIEDVKKLLTGMIEPEMIDVVIGKANIKQIFFSKKKEMIIGAGILSGKLTKGSLIRILDKDGELKAEGQIKSLRKVDKEVSELKEGNDCGIKYVGDPNIAEGDQIEAYVKEEKKRSIV